MGWCPRILGFDLTLKDAQYIVPLMPIEVTSERKVWGFRIVEVGIVIKMLRKSIKEKYET